MTDLLLMVGVACPILIPLFRECIELVRDHTHLRATGEPRNPSDRARWNSRDLYGQWRWDQYPFTFAERIAIAGVTA